MKVKGINFFEQHVEKIVLGAVALVAIGFTARQFLTNPNAVELKGQEYPPSRVDAALAERAEDLQRQLDRDRSLDYQDPGRLSEWFREEQSRNLAGAQTLPAALVRATPLQIGDSAAISGDVGLYAEFHPPAPSDVQVFARPYSLDEEVVADHPELESLLPEDPPYDLPVVHVFAEVNGKAIRESLLAPVEDKNNIPSAWWDRDLMMLDVVVERQRKLSDGSWSETEVVNTIPGQDSVRSKIASASPSQSNEILFEADGLGPDLYQPSFYTLVGGEDWTKKKIDELKPKSPEMVEAINRLKRAWNEVLDSERKLERMLEAEEREDRGSGFDRGGKGGGGESSFGEGGGGGQRETSQDDENRLTPQERMRKRREDAVESAREQYMLAKEEVLFLDPEYNEFPDEEPVERDDEDQPRGREGEGSPMISESFEEGGPMMFGEGGGGKGMAPARGREYGGRSERGRSGRSSEFVPLLEDEERKIWFHDINVAPNAEYRYRVKVAYFNPFFGRSERLADEQRDLAKSMAALSAPTEWSEPIRVVSTKQFFVIDGSYNEMVKDRRASVEVFVFTGGLERMAAMTVRVGEPIGDVRTVMVEADPVEPEEEPDDPRLRRSDPRSRTRGSEPETPQLREMEIDYSTGAVLLDVIETRSASGSGDPKVQVLVALEDGSILVIDPDEHRRSEARARLREMAAKDGN